MTADNSNETSGQDQGSGSKGRGRKPARKRSTAARSGAAKRGRRAASGRSGTDQQSSGRSTSSRSRRQGAGASRSQANSSRSNGIGARLLAGAGRAMPLSSGGGERMVQRLVDERPYMLGAIGLGIGAVIGLMLPGTLSSMTRGVGGGGSGRRGGRR